MCHIVFKPKGVPNNFTKEKFNQALKANPHGIGIAYSEGGKLKIEKFITPQERADEIYNKIANKDSYLIHLRYATCGKINAENIHPFMITSDLCVAHKGSLPDYPELNKDWSDTKNFVEGILKPSLQKQGTKIFKTKEFIDFVQEKIGPENRMIFVDNEMNYSIANENLWTQIDGCWYSNTEIFDPSFQEKIGD